MTEETKGGLARPGDDGGGTDLIPFGESGNLDRFSIFCAASDNANVTFSVPARDPGDLLGNVDLLGRHIEDFSVLGDSGR